MTDTGAVHGLSGRWRRHRRAITAMAVVTLVLAGLSIWAHTLFMRSALAERRAAVAVTAASYASALSNALNERIALVRGLTAFVTVQISGGGGAVADDEFAAFAALLNKATPGIRNISISPDFVVRLVYPVAGNERAIGNDLLKDPRPGFAETVQRSIRTGEVTVHAPLKLLQGGVGVIARDVVFLRGEPWGAVGMVFDLDRMVDEARLNTAGTLQYALRDHGGNLVTGNPAVFAADPIIDRIRMPDGEWQFAVVPAGGWPAAVTGSDDYLRFVMILAAFALLVEMVAFLLVERRGSLERLVEQRTAELTDARRLADRRADELERFAYVAAHDLQEPLRAVSSFTQLLARRLGDSLDEESRSYVQHSVDAARRLKALLRDVQLFLSEEKIPLPTGPIAVEDVMAEVREGLGELEGRTQASVLVESLPAVQADRRRLKEILSVLLSNALQYHHPDRKPEVRVTGRVEGAMVLIGVTDNGVGIDPRFADQVFDVFKRLQPRDGASGTGMGLAIARKMAERLGGRIDLSSEPGVGSTFILQLPGPPGRGPA